MWLSARHPVVRVDAARNSRLDSGGTALCVCGELVLIGDRRGLVHAFSPDGRQYVVEAHRGAVARLRALGGGRVGSVGRDGRAVLWDAEKGRCLGEFQDHRGSINDLAIVGTQLVTVGDEGVVFLRDLEGGESGEAHRHGARLDALVAQGDWVAVGARDGMILLWDANAEEPVIWWGHEGITDLAFAGDSLISCGRDGVVRRWDFQGALLKRVAGHDGAVLCCAVSPDGTRLAAGGEDNRLVVWRLPGLEAEGVGWGHRRRINAVGWAGDAVSVSQDQTWTRWVELADPSWHPMRHREGVRCVVAFGGLVASGSRDYTLRLWNLASGALVHTLVGHEGSVEDVAVSPSGQSLVSVSTDRFARVWSVDSGLCANVFEAGPEPLTSCSFVDEGTVVCGCRDGRARLFTVEGELLLELVGHSNRVRATAVHGSAIVTGSYDGTMKLWRDGTCEATFRAHEAAVIRCRFSTDGLTVASGCLDGRVVLWSLPSGEFQALGDHDAGISGLTFFADGLVSGSKDGVLRMWSLSGELLQEQTLDAAVEALDTWGGELLVGDGDGNIRVLGFAEGQGRPTNV